MQKEEEKQSKFQTLPFEMIDEAFKNINSSLHFPLAETCSSFNMWYKHFRGADLKLVGGKS